MAKTKDTRFSVDNFWWVVLGVQRAATLEQVKEAWKTLADIYHPDKPTGNTEIMQAINDAWDKAKGEKSESGGYANTEDKSTPHQQPDSEQTDFRQYRNKRKVAIQDSDLWDKSLPFPLAWCKVLERFLYLPHADIQLPMLKAISLIPSALADQNLPLVLLAGESGTGKTTIMDLLRYLHKKVDVINAASTYAVIRNKICLYKFGTLTPGNHIERNTVLCYDNVLDDTLADPNKFNLFLGAVARNSSNIFISGGNESPQVKFDTFALTLISTTLPLERDMRTYELHRRFLKIVTSKPDLEQRSNIKNMSVYTWSDLYILYDTFWAQKSIINLYLDTFEEVKEVMNKDARLDPAEIPVFLELVTTGVVCQVWQSIHEAIDNVVAQIKLGKEYIKKSPLEKAMEEILTKYNELYSDGKPSEIIDPSVISEELNKVIKERLITSYEASPKQIASIMKSHGYLLSNRKWRLPKINTN